MSGFESRSMNWFMSPLPAPFADRHIAARKGPVSESTGGTTNGPRVDRTKTTTGGSRQPEGAESELGDQQPLGRAPVATALQQRDVAQARRAQNTSPQHALVLAVPDAPMRCPAP